MTLTAVDSEGVIKTWAQAETNISAAVDGRVFFATPPTYADVPGGKPYANAPPSWVVMSLVSETEDDNDLAMQKSLIQFTCWGKTKMLAAATSVAVQNAGKQLQWGPPVTMASAVIQTGSVSQRRWFPDATTNLPRYVVDLLFLIRGTATN